MSVLVYSQLFEIISQLTQVTYLKRPHSLPEYWGINPDKPIAPPTGGRLPMAGSVGPKSGPNWPLVGDAAGSINPFNGEGIDYAYETGRLAANLVAGAVEHDDPSNLD